MSEQIKRLIETGKEILTTSTSEDSPKTQEEKLAEAKYLDSQIEKEKLRSYRQNTDERKKYAELIFNMSAWWLAFVAFVLVFSGLQKMIFPEAVLLALIGTTTLNVLGLFYIVTKYLFPNK